jgi:opacity protein-like surface antigen
MYHTALRTASAAAIAMALGASPAKATDLLEKEQDQLGQPADIWTGFYGGVGVSGGMSSFDSSAAWTGGEAEEPSAGGFIDGLSAEGFGLTGVVGYDRQFGGKWVLGVGVDGSYSPDGWYESGGAALGNSAGAYVTDGFEKEYDWTGFVRAGFTPTPSTLMYGLLGYTQAHFDTPSISFDDGDNAVTLASSGDQDFEGVSVGVGFETKLDKVWSLDIQGRYTRYEEETIYSGAFDEGLRTEDGLTGEDNLTVEAEPEEWQVLFTLRGKLLTNN